MVVQTYLLLPFICLIFQASYIAVYAFYSCDNKIFGLDYLQISSEILFTEMIYLGYLLLANAAAYFLFCDDKMRAVLRQHRISEFRLLMIAACGGSAGAVLAQRMIRHKTRKQPFADMLLLIIGIQIGAVVAFGLTYLAWTGDHAAATAYAPTPPRIATA